MATAIEVVNCGPIEKLTIPVPENGGLVVLKGTNDIGKSETIAAVEAAVSGRGKIEVRRGSVRGSLSGLGVSVNVGRSMKRAGELTVNTLEGRLSIEDLIEPKVKDPAAADARRIKTLVQVTGAKADPTLFHALVGGREEFDRHVSESATQSDDLVVMADRIKRDFESAARKEESQAEHAEGRAKGAREAAAAVDVTGECDAAKLGAALESAVRIEASLKAQAAAFVRAKRALELARDQLEDQELSYTGPSLEQCKQAEAIEQARVEITARAQREAEERLRAAQAEAAEARNSLAAAINARKAAERHDATVAQFREQLAASMPAEVPAEELARAAAAVMAAREAVERGSLIRHAREQRAESERILAQAGEHRRKAETLRAAARGTEDVLSSLVASCGTKLRVEAGRLMVDTERGPKTFGELSHGTRSKIALDIAIEAVGPGGVICLKQEYWEGIAPAKKRELAEHVRGRGVVVLTAQATDDESITPQVM